MWITSRGEQIPVETLKDDHLMNIIGKLYKKANCRKGFLIAKTKYTHDGDLADVQKLTIDELITHPEWNNLKNEAYKRNLQLEKLS